jgi:hypothetical protein
MAIESTGLRIRRKCDCDLGGDPTIQILLLNGEHPIMQYMAKSLADAERYEAETFRTLRDGNDASSVVFENLCPCSQGERKHKCLMD